MSQLSPGTRLGPYEIVAPIGAGGMGEVYRAKDTRLERQVAIKVLPAALESSAEFRQRFEREARTISSLNHPHICTLYDVGEASLGTAITNSGRSYLVMEYLEGETLADRLERGPLPLQDVLRIGSQIADALGRAHGAGIAHRDLKPANIMLTRSGAKLLDFGLAKSAAPAVSVDALTEQQKPLTAEGTILGTFQYMAPEQLEGADADARTDIFALGVVLYEMATGRRAFEGRTRTSLIASIVAGQPRPLRELQPLTPPQLERIIAKCLEKDPDSRWQSAHDVGELLQWTAGESGAAVAQRKKSILPAVVAGLCLVGGLAAGALLTDWLRPRRIAEPIQASILPPKGVTIDAPAGNGEALVPSPDGASLVFVGTDSVGKRTLWLRSISSREARPLPGTDGARYPFWSPDSRWIAFFASGKLKKVALDGSPPLTICDVASNPLGGDWNSDDLILFSPASGAPLHQVSAAGGTSTAVTSLDASKGETTHRWARFLPDGKAFLYLAGSHEAAENSETNAIYAGRLDSTDRKLILRTRFNFDYADGRLLFVRGDTLFAQAFDPSSLELSGDPVRLISDLHVQSESFFAPFATSETGGLLYVAGAKEPLKELVSLDASGREIARLAEPADYTQWALSPDGSTAALTINDPSEGSDIWLQNLASGARRRLTLGGSGSDPVWSPDGRRVAFMGTDRTLSVKSVEQDGAAEPILKMTTWGGPTAWSPDGRFISIWSFDPKTQNAFDASVLPLDGERRLIPVSTTTAEEFPGAFSPDGRWLTLSSNVSGRHELYVVSSRDLGRRQQISVDGALGGTWKSPNEIVYLRQDSTLMSVTFGEQDGTLTVSQPTILFRDPRITGIELHANRDTILAMRHVGELQPPEAVLVSNWGALLK